MASRKGVYTVVDSHKDEPKLDAVTLMAMSGISMAKSFLEIMRLIQQKDAAILKYVSNETLDLWRVMDANAPR